MELGYIVIGNFFTQQKHIPITSVDGKHIRDLL